MTLWGQTTKCNGIKYAAKGNAAFGCTRRTNNMNGGAVFAIVSIISTLLALIFGILMLARIQCAVIIPFIFTAVSMLTILICWACVAGVMTEKMCTSKMNYSISFDYGTGFVLMITAWCMQVFNFGLLVLIACF
ncbi:amastin-like surface protein-like protein [Strigomonas culicis]|nr:amastin-like surface protein-like protein [Strigomonas culicis]|eukprot:EPY31870.1 amastin-like surface protein-like protein [Strigomonas culicis]